MKYWLIKSEPTCYSIDDFARDKKAGWSGIRNYQARNFMRDSMQVGDLVIFYHSSTNPPSAVGVAKVASETYPDATAQNPKDDHFDPKASAENPIWMQVDMKFVEKFPTSVSIGSIKANPKLKGIPLTQVGSRLSIQPLLEKHFVEICRMGR
ncbi:MAG: EVE domain-containing protein [bacterium]